jgi:hypothetical protein
MNWGKALIVVFGLFILLMVYFFIKINAAGSENTPDNYYEKGNHYQTELDALQSAEIFKPRLQYFAKQNIVKITFDNIEPDSCTLFMECPGDEKNNRNLVFAQAYNETGWQFKPWGQKGLWAANLKFYIKGKKYQLNQKLWLQ